MESFWISVNEATLHLGDLLPDCSIPEFPPDFADKKDEARVIQTDRANLIVITQSCDLEHGKVSLVALCPVWSITAFENNRRKYLAAKVRITADAGARTVSAGVALDEVQVWTLNLIQ